MTCPTPPGEGEVLPRHTAPLRSATAPLPDQTQLRGDRASLVRTIRSVTPSDDNGGAPHCANSRGTGPNLCGGQDMPNRTCSVDGCEKPARSKGMCTRHYDQQRRPTSRPWRALNGSTVAEKIVSNHEVSPEGCWRWTGAHRAGGYAVIWDGERTRQAHRVAYEVAIGPIPEGLQIDHVKARGCAHRDCVNPAHLEAVTCQENLRRGDGPSARAQRQTHCIHGHEFTPENTRFDDRGYRTCRTCARERWRRAGQRRTAAKRAAKGTQP